MSILSLAIVMTLMTDTFAEACSYSTYYYFKDSGYNQSYFYYNYNLCDGV